MAKDQARNLTTPADASRIQASNAKSSGDTGSKSFPARAQAADANNVKSGFCQSNSGCNNQQAKK
ncbi:hypothetical protein OnM2_099035 [Erysiphe neolycopersici]|uniref:SMP domain-containing protein n=1 Tax=Erysiphe neolycopersici TaxID=212602 RepID=A0A420H9X9_9PEZI|nr:hypothetical protein OnM2_099035 [Erysiphe neolycopersici]